MKKLERQWIAGGMAVILAASLLGGCGGSGGGSTTAATTAAPAAAESTKAADSTAAAEVTAAGTETTAAETGSGLAEEIRGNKNPTPEQIEKVNHTLDDSYLGDFYGLGSDYSAYDGRFEGVTLDIWVPDFYNVSTIYPDLSEHPAFKQAAELMGINLNFTVPMIGEESTEFNLMLTGTDLPDIIVNIGDYYQSGLAGAEEDGLILDLQEYEDKLPNYMQFVNNGPSGGMLEKDTVNDAGQRLLIYELCTNLPEVAIGPLLRTKALEDTGWTAPPETIDEWHTFLTDCKNAGYDTPAVFGDTRGFPLNGSSCFATAFGVVSGLFVDENGKVAYGPMQDGASGYLETMSQWYKEGLLDPDYGASDYTRLVALVSSDDVALSIDSPGSWISMLGGELSEMITAAPFPVLNKGDQPVVAYDPRWIENRGASITTQCENIDAALAFLDFGFTKKGWEIYGLGSYGDVHLIDEDGRPYYQEDSLMNTDEETVQYGTYYKMSKFKLHHWICAYSDQDATPTDPAQYPMRALWTNNSKWVGMPAAVSLTAEENARIADIATNIKTAQGEYYLKIITGQLPVSALDEFKQKIQDMGIDEYLSVYQDAYDRYMAR